MSEPHRIWAWQTKTERRYGGSGGYWHDEELPEEKYTAYIRAPSPELMETLRLWVEDENWVLEHCESALRLLIRDLLAHFQHE